MLHWPRQDDGHRRNWTNDRMTRILLYHPPIHACLDELKHKLWLSDQEQSQTWHGKRKKSWVNVPPGNDVHLTPLCQDFERVTSMIVLGVVTNDRLTAFDHECWNNPQPYRVAPKLAQFAQFLYALTLSNINWFTKLFTVRTRRQNVSVSKATIDNKTTSITTHFKKLASGNSVFGVSQLLSKVIVTYPAVSPSMFNVSANCCMMHSSQWRQTLPEAPKRFQKWGGTSLFKKCPPTFSLCPPVGWARRGHRRAQLHASSHILQHLF